MKPHFLTGLVVGCALLITSTSASAQNCGGTERWRVKVGTDTGAADIDPNTPVPITLHQLVTIPRPTIPTDDITRATAEKVVYTVSGRLVRFKPETSKTGDQDYHLVIADESLDYSPGGAGTTPSPHSFVAEVVKPACIPGTEGFASPSQFDAEIGQVRAAFEAKFPNRKTSGWNEAGGVPVIIKGVAFFDHPHGQVGRALNGLELHPILEIAFDGALLVAGGPAAPPAPAPATNLLQNPGFESGAHDWTASSQVITDNAAEPARTGSWNAWLGGYGAAHTDTLCQSVSIPATAAGAALSLYMHVTTEEQTTTQAFDTLKVEIRSASDGILRTLATYSNLQEQPGYQLKTFDLTQFRGQSIKLCFRAHEDKGSPTSFVLDDVRLVVE